MGWSITANGQCADRRAEKSLLLRLALALTASGVDAEYLSMGTDHHGRLDLADLRSIVPAIEATE